jgi:hypothetical protein
MSTSSSGSASPSGSERATRSRTSAATQVAAWTPLVTWPIGISEVGTSGHRSDHMRRLVSPCSSATPLRPVVKRSARAGMLKTGPQPWSARPSSRKSCWRRPRAFQSPANACVTRSNGNASLPAATGVCTVNTVLAATSSRAWSKGMPSATSSRQRSSAMNAECPSFMCQEVGAMPSARSMRTPPMPRTISWAMRVRWSPP